MRRAFLFAAATLLTACAELPGSTGLMDVIERPAERALFTGIRAYDDAQFAEAERQLGLALRTGLVSPRDRAAAHKYLAFVYCTTNRRALCEAAFRAAQQADPAFALTKSEAGHPIWGPVYKRTQP
ncbi:MAG TPA: TssQ family T6SS-associated lipoprotein [Albitalea sp.]|nr:TssQ family T6SS-associated lipoprotein [Albitalea sp.]